MEQHSFKNVKQEKRNVRRLLLLLLLAVLVLGSVTGTILAKYVSENRQQAEMISAKFHISSTYLKEYDQMPVYPIGVPGDLVIDLNNFEVENTAQISAVDMKYTVKVVGGTLTSVKLDGNTLTAENGRYTFTASSDAKTHLLTVTPSAQEVTVTVTAVSPYGKTLSAKFSRNVTSAVPEYAVTQHSEGVYKLTIWTNGYSGNIKIKCNIAPDDTNQSMQSWRTGATETLTVQDNETYELLFFGTAAAADRTAMTDPANTGIAIGTASGN